MSPSSFAIAPQVCAIRGRLLRLANVFPSDFLESQGIAPEVKKPVAPKVGDKRRISSLLDDSPQAVSGPGEAKRPRLSGPGTPSAPPKSRPPSRAPSKNHTVDKSQAPRRPANSRKPSATQRVASGRDLKEAHLQGVFSIFSPGTPTFYPSLLLTPQHQNQHPLASSQSSRTESSSGASALSPLSNAFSDFEDDEYHELFDD